MTFLKEINLKKGSYLVFDKGYVDYEQYQRFSNQGVYFVTRQRKSASYTQTCSAILSQESTAIGVLARSINNTWNKNPCKRN